MLFTRGVPSAKESLGQFHGLLSWTNSKDLIPYRLNNVLSVQRHIISGNRFEHYEVTNEQMALRTQYPHHGSDRPGHHRANVLFIDGI